MKLVLSVTSGPARGKRFVFEKPDTLMFGRGKDARISLPNDPYISRQHFLLEISPPNCKITDLDSKNGTLVNGIRYGGRKAPPPGIPTAPYGAREVLVRGGAEISVGDTVLSLALEQENPQSVCLTEPEILQTRMVLPCALCGKEAAAEAAEVLGRELLGAENMDYLCQECRDKQRQLAKETRRTPPSSQGTPSQTDKTVEKAPKEFSLLSQTQSNMPMLQGYHIEDVVGEGGMGVVYKGMQLDTGREVAIKTLLPSVPVPFDVYRSFQREIEVSEQLKHLNIVELLDHGKTHGIYYLVMEYVNGPDLGRLAEESEGERLPLDVMIPIMRGALAGLAHAHSVSLHLKTGGRTGVYNGIVHRDIKPENILLQQTDHGYIPKLADFGISKSFEAAGLSDMTINGVCGTPAYWPREQITHYRFLHPATDVFSLAAVFYRVLTGVSARPGLDALYEACQKKGKSAPDLADYIRLFADNPVKPIREVDATIPEPIAIAMDRALRETEVPVDEAEMHTVLADLRYPNAGEFLKAMEAGFEKCGLASSI